MHNFKITLEADKPFIHNEEIEISGLEKKEIDKAYII